MQENTQEIRVGSGLEPTFLKSLGAQCTERHVVYVTSLATRRGGAGPGSRCCSGTKGLKVQLTLQATQTPSPAPSSLPVTPCSD